MPDTARYHQLAEEARQAADVLTEIHRILGYHAGHVTPSVRLGLPYDEAIHLYVYTPAKETLRGSRWHKTLLTLSNFYGPPLITRSRQHISAKFTTPFNVDVVLATVHGEPFPASQPVGLDQVLA